MRQVNRVSVAVLLVAALSVTQATLIVHLKNDNSETDLYFKAVFAQTSPHPFNITGRLYVMQTTEVEELRLLDLDGFIVLGPRINTSISSFVQQTKDSKGMGYVDQYYEVSVFSRLYSLPIVGIIYDDANTISDLWEKSNRTLTITIISDDNDFVRIGSSGGSMFLIVTNIVILLTTLAYVCYQLHSFKDGASVTKIALIGLLLSNLGLLADRAIILTQIYSFYIVSSIAAPISIIGPMFIAFSAVFISLYWSTLAFPRTIKMKSKQVFLPILAFFMLALIAYTVTLAIGFGNVTYGLQIAFVIIIFVVATYFIIVGAILIRTLNKNNKIIATKRKITKRLMYMLILAGISMYGVVIVAVIMTAILLIPIASIYATRAILSAFCACSIATLAALFKKPKARTNSSEMNAGSSGDGSQGSLSRFNESR